MSKLLAVVFPIAIIIFVIACLGCDDYNIVEPRFYSEDDVGEFDECDGDPFADPEGVANNQSSVSAKEVVPNGYAVGACWYDREEGILAVVIALPIATYYTVSLLNSGGGVEAIIDEGAEQAGHHVFPCVIEDDGVYALLLQAGPLIEVIWFEVD